jgi:NAD(P)-dependent dehydrogenase (short-subunit alcohol dehydrogenase family)
MTFAGKTVLITGSTSGIGQAAAEAFAARGAEVVVSGRDLTRGASVVQQITQAGGHARFVAADLGSSDDVLRLARDAGDVDVLVNNGGVFPFGATHETSAEEIRAVLEINVTAPFLLAGALVSGMVSRGQGAIVNVSTMVASFGMAGAAAYGSSKAALELLTKAWAAEYGPSGVRVNAVAPGPTRTPGSDAMGEGFDAIVATIPLGRAAAPAEIAATIMYLASEDAAFINGAIVPVDGGRVAV